MAQERLASSGESVLCHPLSLEALPALLDFARQQKPDLTVVGPDNPLALGVVDLFQQEGFRIWGPNKKAAQFESSKAFAQDFMVRHGIPTAQSGIFSEPAAALEFVAKLNGRCAVKADGLALGKGVVICQDLAAATQAINEMLVRKKFGVASERIVIQELLEGIEVSLHALCDGTRAQLFPASQDHKRIFENDHGPNTGGMGAYCPAPFLTDSDIEQVKKTILDRWLEGCRKDGIDFRGILYPGIMLTKDGPKVLEFNARFGDPEAQAYLTRMDDDLLDLLEGSLNGNLTQEIKWKPLSTVCIVMASEGYPGPGKTGCVIRGLENAATVPNVKVFHAGTALVDREFVTSGGRVLGVTAWGPGLAAAREAAYHAVRLISFEGSQYRKDIGAKALAAS
jgi:phosphoribosylamine--glycine ligase